VKIALFSIWPLAASENLNQTGWVFRNSICTLCAANPPTQGSQSLLLASAEKAVNDLGPKMALFWPLFELFYFSTARRSEAPVSRIGRARLKAYTHQSTKAQRFWFLQDQGWKIWKMTFLKNSHFCVSKKQDFCTEISGKVVISPKQPSMVMGKARGLCGTSMGLSLPCYRNLQMFL